jgi:YD repeat-containing protein
LVVGVDERKGKLDVRLPLTQLPGLGGGSVDVVLGYSHDLAVQSVDPHGFGIGWGLNTLRVNRDGGIRVLTPSGGMYEADESDASGSGLHGYTLGDVFFSQTSGVLPAREGVTEKTMYAYSLAHTGGTTYYFNVFGDQIACVDVFGTRVDWEWAPEGTHRLISVTDGGGSQAQLVNTDTGMEIIAPHHEGEVSRTVLDISGSRLLSVTNPAEQKTTLHYQDDGGFLERIISAAGSVTEVIYQSIRGMPERVVDQIRVVDLLTGTQLLIREWDLVGEHTWHGFPTYTSEAELWASGDGEYRYRTRLSDGVTRTLSEYNSMGLMIGREVVVPSAHGDAMPQKQQFVYPATQDGSVPDPSLVPAHYQKPINTTVVFRDDRGNSRTVSEKTVFDRSGRVTKQVSADGSIAVSVYDDFVPQGMVLPVGLMVEQTITGNDGAVTKTVNMLTDDHKKIAATETFSTAMGSTELVRVNRLEYEYATDRAFFSQVPVTETRVSSSGETHVTKHTVSITDGVVREEIISPTGETSLAEANIHTGLPVTHIDSGKRITRYEYDTANRPTKTIFADGTATTVAYTNAHTTNATENAIITGYSSGYV